MKNLKEYENALAGTGPKLKELILDRAAQDKEISLEDLCELVLVAYPEDAWS